MGQDNIPDEHLPYFLYICDPYQRQNDRQIMILLAEIQGFLTSLDIWDVCFILMLAIFLGIEVISNVPAILHTPLMSCLLYTSRCV